MSAAREYHTTFRRWGFKIYTEEINIHDNVMRSVHGVLYAGGLRCKGIGADGHARRGETKH